MPPKQSVPTPKRTRLSYKDKAAIIEATRKVEEKLKDDELTDE